MTNVDTRAVEKARKHREREARRLISDFRPPEGVVLSFHVAGLGSRFAAQTVDLLLTFIFTFAIILLLWLGGIGSWSLRITLGSLLLFFMRAPYYILAELIWNGQTIGKRILRLRVISADGRSLRPYAITVRNLMKEVEVFVPATILLAGDAGSYLGNILILVWIAIVLAVPLLNRRRQRLGDMIAGTYVVYQPKVVLLPDLVTRIGAIARERFTFLPHQLDHYGTFELQTLERILHVDTSKMSWTVRNKHRESLGDIVERIVRKIEFSDRIQPHEYELFLEAFYRAQRQYLENRRLFGDERQDKFHQIDEKEKL